MTASKRGDVVLVGFVFSDESGRKLRPCVVISSPAYGRERNEVVVAAITSNVRRRLFGDHLIADWKSAGLLFPSLATGIIRTVARDIVDRKLGVMGTADMEAVDRELRRFLALWTPPAPPPAAGIRRGSTRRGAGPPPTAGRARTG